MSNCPIFHFQAPLSDMNLCSLVQSKWTGIKVEFEASIPEFVAHFTSCERGDLSRDYYGYSQQFQRNNSTVNIPFPSQSSKIASLKLERLGKQKIKSIQFICDEITSHSFLEFLPPKERLPIHQFLALLGLLWTLV
jgi:hypothetical protein